MEFTSKVVCSIYISVFVLVSVCYVCEARPVGMDMNINSTLKMNESRNETRETESPAIASTPPVTETEEQGNATNLQSNMVMQTNSIQSNSELAQYKSATIGLAVSCAVLFLALTMLSLRYRASQCSTTRMPENEKDIIPLEAKQPVESEYQSIRGLPRRETGNSYVYETVKPRLPNSRPPLAFLLQSNECEYENLKSHDLKSHYRESNPYVPMDEALAKSILDGSALNGSPLTGSDLSGSDFTGGKLTGSALVESGLTGSAVVLSGDEEDLYLTMKKIIRTPRDVAPAETHEICNV